MYKNNDVIIEFRRRSSTTRATMYKPQHVVHRSIVHKEKRNRQERKKKKKKSERRLYDHCVGDSRSTVKQKEKR